MHKVALFDYEFITAICRFNSGRAMMDQIATQRARRAAGGRIFSDVIGGRKKPRMRACIANLDRLSGEGLATGGAVLSVEFAQQVTVHATRSQVCQRTYRNYQ